MINKQKISFHSKVSKKQSNINKNIIHVIMCLSKWATAYTPHNNNCLCISFVIIILIYYL